MDFNASTEFDDTCLEDEGNQLTGEERDGADLVEPIEEHVRYKQVIRELTEFEETSESF